MIGGTSPAPIGACADSAAYLAVETSTAQNYCRLPARLEGQQELLDRFGEGVDFGLAEWKRERNEAAAPI